MRNASINIEQSAAFGTKQCPAPVACPRLGFNFIVIFPRSLHDAQGAVRASAQWNIHGEICQPPLVLQVGRAAVYRIRNPNVYPAICAVFAVKLTGIGAILIVYICLRTIIRRHNVYATPAVSIYLGYGVLVVYTLYF